MVTAVAGAWLLTVLVHLGALGDRLDHHRLADRHAPLLLSVLVVLAMWQPMTVAMMLPSCLPAVRWVAANTFQARRTVAWFVAGYLGVWAGYALVLTIADASLHDLAERLPWLDSHGGLLTAAALGTAAVWQLAPAKRALLTACRDARVLPAHGRRARAASLRFGLRHGLSCVGSCWAMMLVMFSAGIGQLPWMVLLVGIIWLEKVRARGRTLARPTAVAFGALAVAIALAT